MFREDYLTICENGRKKLDFFRSRPFGYFLSAMLAGMFIALGSFAAMCIGGFATAAGSTAVKFLVSLVFAAALSLVIAAGCELFTGNNLVLGAASLNRTVSWRDTALLWFVCYVGNLLGSWVLILIFQATGITGNEVAVDIGTKHAGYIPVSELTDDPTVKVEDLVKVGDEIETYVMRVNDQEGVVTLSKKRLDTVKSWDDIEAACENHTPVEGVVTKDNKGGVEASVRGVRVFIPASQTGLPRDADMSELVKQKVRMRITEVNRARRRVVGSIRAVAQEERAAKAAKVWEEIEEGKRYTGVVKSLTSYGAFVDIGGVDGMVHISELSWSRIKHPSEVVKVGDTVEVYVISFDPEKKKISLGMKDRTEDPWSKFINTYSIGSTANVKVVKLMTFGAFAEIVPGVDGLIHISQIADHRIDKPGDVLSEGQMVDVRITDIDMDNKKVSLSIRALLEDARNQPGEADEVVASSEAEE